MSVFLAGEHERIEAEKRAVQEAERKQKLEELKGKARGHAPRRVSMRRR